MFLWTICAKSIACYIYRGHFLTLQKSPDVDDATEWQIERFLQLLL